MLRKYLKNIRFYILLSSVLITLGTLFIIQLVTKGSPQSIIYSTQTFALLAMFYLYITLLAGPLTYSFPRIPFKNQYLKARRALGVSAFLFASLHAQSGFFNLLGGFSALPFLTGTYLFAVLLGSFSLTIIFFMAATSFDKVIRKMSFKKWKILHRLIYLASFMILIHALILGSHFSSYSQIVPRITFVLGFALLFLEAVRFDNFLKEKFNFTIRFGITLTLTIAIFLYLALIIFFSK